MLSKTSEYAIKALIFIADNSRKGNKSTQVDVANAIDSPTAFTAKILQNLAKNNLVNSQKGIGGGFYLDDDKINNISLMDILSCIEGQSYLKGCVLGLSKCSNEHPCPFHNKIISEKIALIKSFENTYITDLLNNFKSGNSFLKNI